MHRSDDVGSVDVPRSVVVNLAGRVLGVGDHGKSGSLDAGSGCARGRGREADGRHVELVARARRRHDGVRAGVDDRDGDGGANREGGESSAEELHGDG